MPPPQWKKWEKQSQCHCQCQIKINFFYSGGVLFLLFRGGNYLFNYLFFLFRGGLVITGKGYSNQPRRLLIEEPQPQSKAYIYSFHFTLEPIILQNLKITQQISPTSYFCRFQNYQKFSKNYIQITKLIQMAPLRGAIGIEIVFFV